MTDFSKWSEVRADVVAAAGGEEVVAEARKRNQAYIDGHRIADNRHDDSPDEVGMCTYCQMVRAR